LFWDSRNFDGNQTLFQQVSTRSIIMAESDTAAESRPNGASRTAAATAARAARPAANRTRRANRAKADDLEAQVAQLQDDLKSIAQTLTRMGEGKVDEVRSLAKRRAADIKGKGEELVETAQDEFGAFERQIKDTIREKPLTAVAGALALGFLIAVITR
jgi:ElaB/YqjD/DUF883 family membrane-anchored ribosome-binding protein